MRQLPRYVVDNMTKALNAAHVDDARKLEKALLAIDYTDMTAGINAAVEVMEAFCAEHAVKCGELSALFYDAIRQEQVGEMIGAVAYPAHGNGGTEGAVRAFAQDLVNGRRDSFVAKCVGRLSYEGKRAAGETVKFNAGRDKRRVRYARVPTGAETCQFCIMLASRGFVYHSEAQAGQDGHYHDNCDCRVVPSFNGGGVEGYDADAYYDQWKAMEAEQEQRKAEKH